MQTCLICNSQLVKSGHKMCSPMCRHKYQSVIMTGRRLVRNRVNDDPLHEVWRNMIRRCYNPRMQNYRLYGARGIRVCNMWIENFETFKSWAFKNGYRKGLSVERKNTNGHYTPNNCKFATVVEQNRNKRNNRLVTAFGETKCITEWSEDPRCTVSIPGLFARLNKGVHPEEAITNHLKKRVKQFTHCRNGHEYTPENVAFEGNPKRKRCRTCQRAASRRKYAKKIQLILQSRARTR